MFQRISGLPDRADGGASTGVPEQLPQLADVNIDGTLSDIGATWPSHLYELASADHLFGVFKHVTQQSELNRAEQDLLAIAVHAIGVHLHFDIAVSERYALVLHCLERRTDTEHATQAFEQLGRHDRPSEALINTRLQKMDVLLFGSGSYQSDARKLPCASVLLEQGTLGSHPVLRSAVEHHRSNRLVTGEIEHFLNRAGQCTGKSINLQNVTEEQVEL